MRHGCTVLLLFTMGAGAAEPVNTPATRPASIAHEHAMPEQYHILNTRSIFARNGIPIARSFKAAVPVGPGLALRGVVLDEAGYVAVFEDVTTHQTQRIRDGAALGGGEVRNLTLRGFDFVFAGKHVAVAVGQNLQGEIVAPPAPAAPTAVAEGSPAQPKEAGAGEAPAVPEAVPAAVALEGMAAKFSTMAAPPSATPGNGPPIRRRHRPTEN